MILKNNDYRKIELLEQEFNQQLEQFKTNTSLQPWEKISAAFGYALFDAETNHCADDVFNRADQNMYERKKSNEINTEVRSIHMENLQIRGCEIPVVLQRASRKTMEVTLKEGKLNVKAPKDMPIQEITEILESESANIMRKLTEVRYPNNILNVEGISTPVKLIRSDRKMITVEVQHSEVIIRAPYDAPEEKVMKFLLFKAKDIEEAYQQNKASAPERLSQEELLSLFKKAEEYIPQRVQYYASLIGVAPLNVTIRNQKTRWGNCSDKGNLNFNCLLMLAPVEVIDSVVVHELCHLKYMNHSQDFYEEIYRVYPEYDKWNQWLKENDTAIVRRMTG